MHHPKPNYCGRATVLFATRSRSQSRLRTCLRRWGGDVDGLDRPAVDSDPPDHFEPGRMIGRVGEVFWAIVGHHEDRGIGGGQPALEERASRRRMIGIVVASRQVIERVVQLADEM